MMPPFHAMRSRGSAIVEFAFILPVLMLVLGGAVDFSSVFRARLALSQAVASGANYAFSLAQTNPDKALDVSDVTAATKAAAPAGSTITIEQVPSACVVNGVVQEWDSQPDPETCPNGMAPGSYVTVSASYHYTSMLPIYSMLSPGNLTASLTARLK